MEKSYFAHDCGSVLSSQESSVLFHLLFSSPLPFHFLASRKREIGDILMRCQDTSFSENPNFFPRETSSLFLRKHNNPSLWLCSCPGILLLRWIIYYCYCLWILSCMTANKHLFAELLSLSYRLKPATLKVSSNLFAAGIFK